ncbi:hypothetical protein, partial [Lentzea sp. NPDC060358]|uniref:hypothetical protein n=1 Tax=Lentzea sp. NPDC060358 TaxID=3347103 RepID=UPI003646F0BE
RRPPAAPRPSGSQIAWAKKSATLCTACRWSARPAASRVGEVEAAVGDRAEVVRRVQAFDQGPPLIGWGTA